MYHWFLLRPLPITAPTSLRVLSHVLSGPPKHSHCFRFLLQSKPAAACHGHYSQSVGILSRLAKRHIAFADTHRSPPCCVHCRASAVRSQAKSGELPTLALEVSRRSPSPPPTTSTSALYNRAALWYRPGAIKQAKVRAQEPTTCMNMYLCYCRGDWANAEWQVDSKQRDLSCSASCCPAPSATTECRPI